MPKCELLLHLIGRQLCSKKGDDSTLLDPLISQGHPIDTGELLAQCRGKKPDPLADSSESPGEGIVDGDTEGKLSSITAFPAFEAFCIAARQRCKNDPVPQHAGP